MKRSQPDQPLRIDQYFPEAKKIKIEQHVVDATPTTGNGRDITYVRGLSEAAYLERIDPPSFLPPVLKMVVSGGQTGADRAALDAAIALGIRTGGWAPEGYQTLDGCDLSLRDTYKLKEMKAPAGTSIAQMYVARSKKNVDMAHGTIAFRLHASAGTDKTIQYCLTGHWRPWDHNGPTMHKPVLVITSLDDHLKAENMARIRQFIRDNNIQVLNVAGHRDAPATTPDFYLRVKALLQDALIINKGGVLYKTLVERLV